MRNAGVLVGPVANDPGNFGLDWPGTQSGRSLADIMNDGPDLEREILSQHHAAGAVSGAFMLVHGRWKLAEYIGFDRELFDLEADEGELNDVAQDNPEVVAFLRDRLPGTFIKPPPTSRRSMRRTNWLRLMVGVKRP